MNVLDELSKLKIRYIERLDELDGYMDDTPLSDMDVFLSLECQFNQCKAMTTELEQTIRRIARLV